MGLFYMLDPLYLLLVGPAFILALIAQAAVKGAYARYSKVGLSRQISGAEAAAMMLQRNGLSDVNIEMTRGMLSDHYDPRSRTLRLSPGVYQGRSVAAVGIAAHEAGHALQHASRYAPMIVRHSFVPIASLGSWLAFPIIFIGFLFQSLGLIQAGIILFAGIVAFQLITLPVEFNASRRAKLALTEMGILLTAQEEKGVRSVLTAAAMTYVAATAAAIMQLLYFVLRAGIFGGDD